MRSIDSNKVAKKTYKCGKKLKVSQIAQAFVQIWDDLTKSNPTMIEIKEKLEGKLYDELFQTLITFFALNLLARTHNKKEFDEIINSCEIEDA